MMKNCRNGVIILRRITIGFVFCILASILMFSAVVLAQGSQQMILYSGEAETNTNNDYREAVLELVNVERAKHNLSPLRMSNELLAGAEIRAKELTVLYSHTRPDGTNCKTVIAGKNRYIGENIAAEYITPKDVVTGWMNSAGHRANILNPNFEELGVGYIYFDNDPNAYWHYWVQIFRGKYRIPYSYK